MPETIHCKLCGAVVPPDRRDVQVRLCSARCKQRYYARIYALRVYRGPNGPIERARALCDHLRAQLDASPEALPGVTQAYLEAAARFAGFIQTDARRAVALAEIDPGHPLLATAPLPLDAPRRLTTRYCEYDGVPLDPSSHSRFCSHSCASSFARNKQEQGEFRAKVASHDAITTALIAKYKATPTEELRHKLDRASKDLSKARTAFDLFKARREIRARPKPDLTKM